MADKQKPKRSWLRDNGLSITVLILTVVFLAGQAYTGWHEHNKSLEELGGAALSFGSYLTSGHFLQATFENWESEFLQMACYVMLTVLLYQKGSSESKDPDKPGEDDVEKEPEAGPDAPWPVRHGGFILKLYKNSLSIVLVLLFLICFYLHLFGSMQDHNSEAKLKGEPEETMSNYITGSRFWFESFQNWQSEFLSVAVIVLFTVWFRQKGSPESKPVDTPDSENE